jgi:methionyl-tRNA formyltransferase
VKVLAQSHGLTVLAPESLKNNQMMNDEIKSWSAEVAVVVAFGQILTQEFLDSFRFGCVNVHGSILPAWRGAAPIQRSIEAGDTVTGVTLQKMVKKLDAGDIIGIRKVNVPEDMDALQLHDELALLGADLLRVELMDYIRGNLSPIPQDESKVTVARKIDKSESLLDWTKSAKSLNGKIRGFTYGPGTYTILGGKKLKIHKAQVIAGNVPAKSGTVTAVNDDSVVVATGDGSLKLLEVQPESRTRMKVNEFLKGNPLKVGDQIGV